MNDSELRALVREAVERHLGRGAGQVSPPAAPSPVSIGQHPSHGIYLAVVNTSDACVIEPSVPCNHCNYCRSHGH
jgi:threonine dehydrogenase-like Zn-dependent dehydrogenase